jgi:hypothetical protein
MYLSIKYDLKGYIQEFVHSAKRNPSTRPPRCDSLKILVISVICPELATCLMLVSYVAFFFYRGNGTNMFL